MRIIAAVILAVSCGSVFAQGDSLTLPLSHGTNQLVAAGRYRVGIQMIGKAVRWLPIGWSGHFATPEGISYTPWNQQAGRQTLLVHPPWRGGTGDTIVEYDLALPNERPITFKTGIAMWEQNTEKSDGVTFRAKLIVDGQTLPIFDQNYKGTTWRDYSFDLSRWAGRTVILRLESNPGPANDPSFDFGLFGDPQVIVGQATPGDEMARLVAKSAPSDADVSVYANDNTVGVRPTTPPGFKNSVSKQGDIFVFESRSGADTLTYKWDPAQQYLSGLTAVFRKDDFVCCNDSGPRFPDGNPAQRSLVSASLDGDKAVVVEKYTGANAAVTLTVTASIAGNSLMVDTVADQPGVSALAYGAFSRMNWRRTVNTPYLTFGEIMYLQDSRAFASFLPDWTASQASSMETRQVHYDPLTDKRYNKLSERVCITVAPHYAGVLPNLPNPPSPYLKDLSDRVIADIWGGTFTDNEAWLHDLASYGVENIAIFNHDWQRGGYDNEYPTVLPARKEYGGDEAMKKYADTAKALGYRFGLHENYVDFYPNSEAWNPDDVALDSNGKMVPAWKNIIQSYAYKPTAIVPYAEKYGPQIHDRFGTSDCFLDVHSAVPPWFHVDARATEPGAGTFEAVRQAHIGLWKAERAIHGGPVFGEGANHFFWSGYLDGTEAQVGGGEDQPLLLDFDLLKIHPLQLNHGMGYIERWLRTGYNTDWSVVTGQMPKRDRYRAMQVAYGHAGYMAAQVWKLLPHAVREYYLTRPVMQRTTLAKVERIEYEANGKMVSADVAAVFGGLGRAHIRYDNGFEVWSNISDTDWKVGDSVIPANGYLAKGPGIVSGTTVRQGQVSDYRDGDGVVFADGRCHDERGNAFNPVAEVSLADATVTGPRSFRVTYKFAVKQAIKGDCIAFVHFTNEGSDRPDKISFQQDHSPKTPTSQWKPGDVILDGPWDITMPDGAKPGDYPLLIGLVNPDGRLRMIGNDDGGTRYLLATVTLKADGLTITPAGPPKPVPGPTAAELRINAGRAPIDFGKIITCGCVALKPGDGSAELISVPHDDKFPVSLRTNRIDPKWRAGTTRCEAIDAAGKSLGAVALKVDGDTVTFEVGQPGAVKYRFTY
jgi:hypothetical protein